MLALIREQCRCLRSCRHLFRWTENCRPRQI